MHAYTHVSTGGLMYALHACSIHPCMCIFLCVIRERTTGCHSHTHVQYSMHPRMHACICLQVICEYRCMHICGYIHTYRHTHMYMPHTFIHTHTSF